MLSGESAFQRLPQSGLADQGQLPDRRQWETANVCYLRARLEALRAMLAEGRAATDEEAQRHRDMRDVSLAEAKTIAQGMSDLPAIDAIEATFGLTRFESTSLLFCAAWELDRASLCAEIDAQHGPTLEAALALLPSAHWSMCTPDAPLRSWRLVNLGPSNSLLTRALRIEEPVLHYLKGVKSLSTEVRQRSRLLPPADPEELRGYLDQLIEAVLAGGGESAVQLVGKEWQIRELASAFGDFRAAPTREIAAKELPSSRAEMDDFVALLGRDTKLGAVTPLIMVDADGTPALIETIQNLAAARERLLLIGCTAPIRLSGNVPLLRLRNLGAEEKRMQWVSALAGSIDFPSEWVDRLASQFELEPAEIQSICRAWTHQQVRGAEQPQELWNRCVDMVTPQLEGLAERLSARDGSAELVLAAPQRLALEAIRAQVRTRWRVDSTWGMYSHGSRGRGISVLLSGPSGTGKTLAAEALAFDLNLPLYRVDLSQVVSKYIGETEKHLKGLFDAAERGGFVLLFDEADALFGKRSEVSSAHDRYANIEVSYLLQRIEGYSGLAILTTNHRENVDPAFLRRMRFLVHFPAPGESQRSLLWERAFPKSTPCGALDTQLLAEAGLTGGAIRNAALVAAGLAADGVGQVEMPHVLDAIRMELAKNRLPMIGISPKQSERTET